MRSPDSRGFTLIEVVVALAILGIGMLAVFKTIGDTVNNVEVLRDRSFAEWIADNRITEIRLTGEMPSVEETAGEVEFAGRQWHWVTTISQTQVRGLRRIDVSVRRDEDPEDSSLVTLSGFVGAVATAAPQANDDWYADLEPGDGDGDGDGDEDDEDDEQVPPDDEEEGVE
ncbi:MAG TPA: type II secretion system minor pseudopilin GspI [Steroidobacteraceae bacterium]|nr:type II secretion system minor pseudopilin GspI [Steroidobacteraceae bacterium]